MNYKYFISQPMKGKTVQEIKEERKFIVNYLESIWKYSYRFCF